MSNADDSEEEKTETVYEVGSRVFAHKALGCLFLAIAAGLVKVVLVVFDVENQESIDVELLAIGVILLVLLILLISHRVRGKSTIAKQKEIEQETRD